MFVAELWGSAISGYLLPPPSKGCADTSRSIPDDGGHRAAGLGDGDYEIWGETITVKDGRTSNPRGAIAGSVITMLEAVRTMKSLGVSEIDLAKMAATNPARLLGVDQNCGTIEEGKRADLVAMDAQRKVVLTMVGGSIAYDARNTIPTD